MSTQKKQQLHSSDPSKKRSPSSPKKRSPSSTKKKKTNTKTDKTAKKSNKHRSRPNKRPRTTRTRALGIQATGAAATFAALYAAYRKRAKLQTVVKSILKHMTPTQKKSMVKQCNDVGLKGNTPETIVKHVDTMPEKSAETMKQKHGAKKGKTIKITAGIFTFLLILAGIAGIASVQRTQRTVKKRKQEEQAEQEQPKILSWAEAAARVAMVKAEEVQAKAEAAARVAKAKAEEVQAKAKAAARVAKAKAEEAMAEEEQAKAEEEQANVENRLLFFRQRISLLQDHIKALEDYQDSYGNGLPPCKRHNNIAGLDKAREELVKIKKKAEALEKKKADAQSSNSKNNNERSFEFNDLYEDL